MRFFTRGLLLFALSMGMFTAVGCGVDNEEEGKKLAKQAGDPGPPSPKAIPSEKQTAPTSESERGQRLQDAQKGAAGQGYPGAKKK